MRNTIILITLLASSLTLISCKALLQSTATPASLPVLTGAATTNDLNIVAYLKEAQQVNSLANLTPTQAPINSLLSALIPLASAAAGFFTSHMTKAKITTVSTTTPPATKI